FLRSERLRTELLHGPLRRALADPSRVHLPEAASRLAVVADLTIAVLGRNGRRHDAAIRLAERRAYAGSRGDDGHRFGIAVGRLAELLHARIGRAGGVLDGERDRAALAQRPVNDAGLIDVEIGVVDRLTCEREILIPLGEPGHPAGGVGASLNPVHRKIACESEAEPLLVEHSDANAPLATSNDGFDR